jgi:hypothetical protein
MYGIACRDGAEKKKSPGTPEENCGDFGVKMAVI